MLLSEYDFKLKIITTQRYVAATPELLHNLLNKLHHSHLEKENRVETLSNIWHHSCR
jgi:hypothetical protein